MNKRHAYFRSQFRTDTEDEDLYIEGYFAKFNSETKLWDGFYERIDPQAFNKSLQDKEDIRVLFNHDSNIVLGRTTSGTANLSTDEIGLKGRVKINKEDRAAMDAYARVKRGDISGCSFGFFPVSETIKDRQGGGLISTLNEADLFEVSVCTFPAYPQTEIEARQRNLKNLESEKLERTKQKLKERLEAK